MPFALDDFVAKRPYLYHLTARANLPYLRAERRLHSTTALLHAAGLEPLNRTKRKEMRSIAIGEHTVILRDQAPLYEGHVALADGWIFDDLLADLNRRVYFWPDDTDAPIDYGRRHFARYATPGHPYESIILRIPFASLLATNPDNPPLFSQYNSGSPRHNQGLASPRGPRTFLPAADFPLTPSRVVEITFVATVALPADATTHLLPDGYQDSDRLTGTWSPLFI